MMFPKEKPTRLHGAALRELNHAIHERDNHSCIICGQWVDEGEKFHHYPFGRGKKSDEISKGVTLCYQHHNEAHNKKQLEIAEQCEAYLVALYGKKLGQSPPPQKVLPEGGSRCGSTNSRGLSP